MRTTPTVSLVALLLMLLPATAAGQGRVFMVESGADPSSAPAQGPTALHLQPGECRMLHVWVEDRAGLAPPLHDYSIVLPWVVPGGAAGQLEYQDIDPQCDGHTVDVDTQSPQWVFAVQEPLYSGTKMEAPGETFGVLHHTLGPQEGVLLASDDVPHRGAPNYLAEFAYCASAGACGKFEVRFDRSGDAEASSIIRTPEGTEWPATWQPLEVIVGDPSGEDCARTDMRSRADADRPRGGDAGAGLSADAAERVGQGVANDDCANAQVLPSELHVSTSYSTSGATPDGDPTGCGGGANDVWFMYTAPSDDVLIFSASGSGIMTVFQPDVGCTPGAADVLSCGQSISAITGEDYLIRINSGQPASGVLSINGLRRAWMVAQGDDPGAAPLVGPTTMQLAPGTCRTIDVWLQDTTGAPPLLNGCQIIMPWFADGGDSGTVSYLNGPPFPEPDPGGNTILIDKANPDWVFTNLAPIAQFQPVSYNETNGSIFGSIYNYLFGQGISLAPGGDAPNPGGPNYFTEFTYCASPDASGTFDLNFNRPPNPPPLTECFNPFCSTYGITWSQPLQIEIVDCLDLAQCADQNGDGIRDDPCLFYSCVAGQCVAIPRGFLAPGGQADTGGFGGACPVDGVCDNWDYGHALKCFSNTSTTGTPPYECEPDFASEPVGLNVDAGSVFGSCVLDGVCDVGDALHALQCFSNIGPGGEPGYPCQCPTGPQPAPPPPARPAPVAMTGLTLAGPLVAAPGQRFDVDVYIDAALPALQGYQLHLDVSGGTQGRIEIVDLSIDTQRADYVYAGSPSPGRAAFNVGSRQMLNILETGGVATPERAYLATLTLAASEDARGAFVVDLLHDEVSARPQRRTFLLATLYDPIGIERVAAARVQIVKRARGHVLSNP